MLTMNSTDTAMKTTLRIPGNWSHPGELIERMPPDFRLTPETLILPDGVEIEFAPMPPDDQFARIFESSCRRPATADELEIVREYTVNVGLTGPCGSMQAAATMMQAGAAIVRAGAAGVFIDNSGLAHGGGDWIEMAEDESPDARRTTPSRGPSTRNSSATSPPCWPRATQARSSRWGRA